MFRQQPIVVHHPITLYTQTSQDLRNFVDRRVIDAIPVAMSAYIASNDKLEELVSTAVEVRAKELTKDSTVLESLRSDLMGYQEILFFGGMFVGGAIATGVCLFLKR